MRKDARSVLCLLILALFGSVLGIPSAGAAQRPETLGTVGGQVFGSNGFAAEGVRVILQASDGSGPRTTVTNTQGRFWFPLLSSGLYDVRASSQGGSSEWRHNVAVNTARQTTISLHLRPKKPAASKSAASLKQP